MEKERITSRVPSRLAEESGMEKEWIKDIAARLKAAEHDATWAAELMDNVQAKTL